MLSGLGSKKGFPGLKNPQMDSRFLYGMGPFAFGKRLDERHLGRKFAQIGQA